MASADGSPYGGLYEYKKHPEEDLALCPDDLLAVNKAGLVCLDYKEGDEKNFQGWLHGFTERTKEWRDFPGMYREYLGPGRTVATTPKSRPRPLPPTPTWMPSGHAWEQSGHMESVDQLNHPEQALLVIMRLVEALEKEGLHNEALYQSPPGSFGDAQLKKILLTDLATVELDSFDGQTLAEMLKCYLKELPCPVIHPAIYNELLFIVQAETEDCGKRIKLLLESPCLSQWHRLLLQHLTRHFCKLCQHSHENHLTPKLLGEAFSEVLFRPTSSSMEMNPEQRVKIIEALIAAGGVSENQDAPASVGADLSMLHCFSTESPNALMKENGKCQQA